MKTKKDALSYLESNYEVFLQALNSQYKYTQLDGEMDLSIIMYTLKNEEFSKLTVLPILNINFYTHLHCGCIYDCCGCGTSVSIDIINNKNGYITIFVKSSYNY